MKLPRVIIDTGMVTQNVKSMVGLAKNKDVEVIGVTKGFCAAKELVSAYVEGGVSMLADSRLENLIKLKEFPLPKLMLRLPMLSEVEQLVEYADISLNSELEVVKALDKAAQKANKKHGVILMADLGDLREGYFDEAELKEAAKEVLKLANIELKGIGVNFNCYGGVIPESPQLNTLYNLAKEIETENNIKLPIVSGGNSGTAYLLLEDFPQGINNLRLGETLIRGTESSYGKLMPGTSNKAFKLEAEIIEIKSKPSKPIGKIGKDAFGKDPIFEDVGIRKRALLAIGKQDVDLDSLLPLDKKASIMGASSDHIIVDITDSEKEYKLGDAMEFYMEYVSILRTMTSPYVEKVFI